MRAKLEWEIERLVERLGFELVALERGGAARRPLLRLRIDRPDGEPGRSSVTAEDCASVSRALHERFVGGPHGLENTILEVSSPGVERPLVRPRDFARFAGRAVVVRGYRPLVGNSRQVEGVLLGLAGDDGIAIEVGGERVELGLESIARATLAYRWEDDLRASVSRSEGQERETE